MLPGLGAVATTFIAGVMAVRRNLGKPIGSLSQLQTIRLGAQRESLPFDSRVRAAGGLGRPALWAWDSHGENALQVARRSKVLETPMIDTLASRARAHHAIQGRVQQRVRPHAQGRSRQARQDQSANWPKPCGKTFAISSRPRRLQAAFVVLWTGSTEVFRKPSDVHRTLAAFEAGMERNDPEIAPSMLYAWAAMKEGCAYANGAPNLALETPRSSSSARAGRAYRLAKISRPARR